MGKYIITLILGIALFVSGVWYLDLFPHKTPGRPNGPDDGIVVGPVTPASELGDHLYPAEKFKPIDKRTNTDPIVLYGLMNAFEVEDVPSLVPGRILFIGDQVDDGAVLAAGSAAFLAEPYYFASIYAGRQTFVKFYRRHYEGDIIKQGQMLGMVEPAKAFGAVLEKIAKLSAAEADYEASKAAEKEGHIRKLTADGLFAKGAIGREEHGAAVLTWIKLINERISAGEKIKLAEIEKDIADIDLYQHEIRAVLPYRSYTIKSIQRGAGAFLKQLDPVVMTVQNLERLMAEAQIEEQYAARLQGKGHITATIEPTILEAPTNEFPGHTLEVTSVAVSRDMKIVSASEDHSICIWKHDAHSPDRTLKHDDAVRVVACAPAAAKDNICLGGCANGVIYLWNLDKEDAEPIKLTHGSDASITSLAFSPDGKLFASGASDGSIKLWTTEDAVEKYAFVPANGVAQCHEDAVTSLHFTPQCKLISAGRDNSLRVWSLMENGAAPDGKPILNRKGNVPHLGVSSDGQWMLFDQGHTLKMYSVETKNFVHTLSLPANATPFETLALFSPDGSLMLTAGAPKGRLQLWRTPDAKSRGFEVRQFATREELPVACAAFSPEAGQGSTKPFAVSASGTRIYKWALPTAAEVKEHRIENVRLTLKTQALDPITRQTRVGFEVANPDGRFEAGRLVTIVID